MSLIVRMVSVLLLLLGLMLLALYGFKKFDLQRRNFLGMNKYMHIVDRLYLGPKKSLALVQVGPEHILVGMSAGRLTFLSKISLPTSPDDVPQKQHETMSFNEMLHDADENLHQHRREESAMRPMGTEFLKRLFCQTIEAGKNGFSAKRNG